MVDVAVSENNMFFRLSRQKLLNISQGDNEKSWLIRFQEQFSRLSKQ